MTGSVEARQWHPLLAQFARLEQCMVDTRQLANMGSCAWPLSQYTARWNQQHNHGPAPLDTGLPKLFGKYMACHWPVAVLAWP
jgi:hypothetical protein